MTTNSIFSSIVSTGKANTPDDLIEDKFSKRAEEVSESATSFENYRENAITKDLSLKASDREKMFKEKRLKQKIKVDYTQSLKDKLTIPLNVYEECNKIKVEATDLPKYIQHFKSENVNEHYMGLVGIRKILSIPERPPIQDVIDSGLVSEFVRYLDHQLPEFQFEALWCLTNVASGTSDQASTVVNKGGLVKIISLMESKIQEIQDQAIWTIGNLAGDSAKIRDRIVHQKGYERLLKLFATAERPTLIKHCTWAISNFCRTKPPMEYSLLKQSVDFIISAIYKLDNDQEFLIDACWILSFMTETYKKSIQKIIDTNVLPKLVSFIEYPMVYIQLPCLRIVGNIVAGNAAQTQLIIDLGVLNLIKKTIFHEKRSIRKESCWIISNVAAGTQQQIDYLIANDFLPILQTVIKNDEPDIQKEAIWALCNLTSTENRELMEHILRQGILEMVCECLKMKDAKFVAVSLEALGNLLNFGKVYYTENGRNLIVAKVEQLGMFDVLEGFQYHPVEIVYEKTIKLLEAYFETENTN